MTTTHSTQDESTDKLDRISIVWCIEDIQSVDDTISNEDARTILQAIKEGHDATIGVNWEVLEYYVDLWKEGKL